MSVSEIKVVGGQIEFKYLTNKVAEKDYEVRKAIIWHKMLGDGMLPTRWLKPTAKGTKVNFDQIQDQEGYDKAIVDLKHHLNAVNEKYGTDLEIG
ncbi:hypothetical protein H70357_24725 [Paenibacillus sp. FSL H7-0357]|uniref:hypothetical protein n=1 Tax=Paenibacillus sp. FSL H7-0357 TaxID=1536774 RepID=UPI0004F61BC1|nr:hypothetical protein [Paenibacillus sp. FSL H7-0357]AIQ19557.1 hypothetical protein H70357_24725 [Paenibacillus sp. FSL H7-0357]